MKKYLLGVDGGNTKTDYLLYTTDGEFVDVYRCGSCSHERMDDGYDGMERTMRAQLSVILERNNITVDDIAAGGFGLAGGDLPSQITELKKRVENIGFRLYGVSNDGIMGIKAASDSGMGLCGVNGTGTVVIGIDETDTILQVGGVGAMSGDFAGGGYAMHQAMTLLYAYYYRCGEYSSMFPAIMELLHVQKEDLLAVVSDYDLLHKNTIGILQIADREARQGDAVAMSLFDTMGDTMGHSAAGCTRLLSFDGTGTEDNPLVIVLVGSIWNKIQYTGMLDTFAKTVETLTGKHCRCIPLKAPAAVGGVLWAKELLENKNAAQAGSASPILMDYRQKVLSWLTLERYEQLVFTDKG